MGKTVMGAVVSLDGLIADDLDAVDVQLRVDHDHDRREGRGSHPRAAAVANRGRCRSAPGSSAVAANALAQPSQL